MNWNCVNDPFGKYCQGTPDWEKEPTTNDNLTYLGGKCKLNSKTCGKCKTSKELWEELPESERNRIEHSTFVTTVIPISSSSENKETKPKSKNAKKFEAELAQKSML